MCAICKITTSTEPVETESYDEKKFRNFGHLRRSDAHAVPRSQLSALPRSVRSLAPTDRTVLPIPEPKVPSITTFDARNATPPPRFVVEAPKGAPNVLIVLIDDMGFGMSEAFGGPIHMPTVTRLANNGLRYNQFHTTALCSPTRAALMSGRNHHVTNFGSIAETATLFPGQTGQRPESVAYLAEMVRLNGYSTAQFGKNHETAPWEVSPVGTNRSLADSFRFRQVLRLHGR
jgi:arylsulfatase